MKLGILADIHGNLEALSVCLESLGAVPGFICPGDIVGYGPNPRECIEIVRKLNCSAVAGNHDRAATGMLDPSYFTKDAKEAIEWTKMNLASSDVEFLASLPEYLAQESFEMVHGSLRNPLVEYVTNVQEGAETIGLMKKKICFVGHLHIPLVIVKDKSGKYDGWQLNDGDVIDTSKFDKVLVNAGSVGQPRDMDRRASFGIYDTAKGTVEIKKVEYNIDRVQEKMRAAGLPDFLVERLSYGR